MMKSLLTLTSLMAHQHARGFWTAPETRPLQPKSPAAAYCAPAQPVVPMMLRWMLVLEDPATHTLWLAKGTPRAWLADGQRVVVEGAPTCMGKVGFEIHSRLGQKRVEADLQLPATGATSPVKLRLRAPEGYTLEGARVDGRNWRDSSPQEETVTLPAGAAGKVQIEISDRGK
jgi:hypothetical protein